MKRVAVLGSTGSVGVNALRVIARHKDKFRVIALTANRNTKLLARQIKRFNVRHIALGDKSQYNELKRELSKPRKVLAGQDGISEIASLGEADIILLAISGTCAIIPLISAIRAGKRIALANKESVVSAGRIIMNMARTHRAEIIPVDSEHNSIFQCIKNEKKDDIEKVFLMGSGGPLRNVSRNIFDRLKPSRILAHPVWKMGKKISVDSATMMNKGLEAIEASHLFGINISRVKVLLHPEAVIHSMVEFRDGNLMANLFSPDMKIPIFYALIYPERKPSGLPRVDFSKINNLSFLEPDLKKFPALRLCYDVARKGGTAAACLNSANECAVGLYLKKRVSFTGIIKIVKKVLSRHKNIKDPSLDEILHVDKWARKETESLCTG